MPNSFHEANRRAWDARARHGLGQVDRSRNWFDCFHDASQILLPEELAWLGGIAGKQVCVLGSGDNLAVFALAGLGAALTSVDISREQLRIAGAHAEELRCEIRFLWADVTDLTELTDKTFDVVYTGGHVAVWVSDLNKYYSEAVRILKPGGQFIVNEYHPFRRSVLYQDGGQHQYFDRGPFAYDKARDLPDAPPGPLPSFEFQWTVADFVHALRHAGAELLDLDEVGDESECWETADVSGLPRCLLLYGRKPG